MKAKSTLELLTDAIDSVIDKVVEERSKKITKEDVVAFINGCNSEDEMFAILDAFKASPIGGMIAEEDYNQRLNEDKDVVFKEAITADTVKELNLLEPCYKAYVSTFNNEQIKEHVASLLSNVK